MSEDRYIQVRATVNLPGLQVGRRAMVDPELPWIKAALKNKTLVKERTPRSKTEPTSED